MTGHDLARRMLTFDDTSAPCCLSQPEQSAGHGGDTCSGRPKPDRRVGPQQLSGEKAALAKQRLFGRFALLHAALGELPAAAAGSAAKENLAVGAHQDDSDVGAKAVCIDEIVHGKIGRAHV